MHESIVNSQLDLLSFALLADVVDAFYISLNGAMDVFKEGAGKVYHRSPIRRENFALLDTNLRVTNIRKILSTHAFQVRTVKKDHFFGLAGITDASACTR